jgi:transposase
MSNRTTTHAQRVEIVERRRCGQTIQQIAQEMQLNFYTVRKWWRAYRDGGWSRLVPGAKGRPASGALSTFDPEIKYVALRLKRQHPAWGLDVLRLEMSRRASLQGKQLPRRSTLYSYLRTFHPRLQEHRHPRTRCPTPPVERAQRVHERWQMDFKGIEPVGEVGCVSPLLVCDEFSSAPLLGKIYPAGRRTKPALTARDVQVALREVFSQWGLPAQLRMDRDPLWVGSTRLEWPGVVLLWLVGLDVTPIINRPRRPTDNAQVERCGRTWNEHVALGANCQTLEQVQALTDRAWTDRREHLPSRNPNCAGRPPLRALPQLAHPRRSYSPQQEADLFDMQRVYAYLSQWEWERKVDHQGCISMADHNRRVSLDHVGQIVKVRFDHQSARFVTVAVDGIQLSRFTLPVITQDYIQGVRI